MTRKSNVILMKAVGNAVGPKSRHNSIASRAMLATLHISRWSATRTDKAVTQDVANQHGVDSRRAGKYRKNAIDPQTPLYAAIMSAISSMRTRHYYWTLPWGEDGTRILPAANFEKYSAEMRLLRGEYDRCVAEFVKAYDGLVRDAKRELAALFNADDYPTDIASKWGVEIRIMPLPDAQDFRVDLPDDAIDEIRANITKEIESSTAESMREPFTRLFDHVHRMVERLGDPESPLRATLVTNLRELLDVLPGLNITNDAKLNEFSERAKQLIENVDIDVIKTMPAKRAEIAEAAEKIEADMAAFMGVTRK